MKNIKVSSILLLIVSCATIMFSNFMAINMHGLNLQIINKNIPIIIFCIIVAVIKNLKGDKTQSSNTFVIIWIIFLTTVIISKIINKDKDIFNIIILMLVTPFFFKKNSYNTEKYIFWACIINLIPLIYLIKSNNTIGMIIVIIEIVAINLSLKSIIKNNKYILYTFIVVAFGTLIFMTKSRTSLITCIVISVINYIYIMINGKLDAKKIIKSLIIGVMVIFIVSMLYNTLYDLIFNKYTASKDNMTTGRDKIWEKVLSDDITAFGNGEKYIEYRTGYGDAHNVFVQIFGHYGLIPLLFYLFILIYIVKMIIKKDRKIEYINFYLGYLLIGLFENISIVDTRFIIYNLLFLVYTGMLLRKNEEEKIKIDKKGNN